MNEEYLQVQNQINQLITENNLSTDNFQTVMVKLFYNIITDTDMVNFLKDKLHGCTFVAINTITQLVYEYVREESPDELLLQDAKRERDV